MFTNFKDLEAYVLAQNTKKRIALANAHDEPALSAVVNAKRKGVVEGTLIGKEPEIIEMLHEMGENEADYEIIHFDLNLLIIMYFMMTGGNFLDIFCVFEI